MKKTNNINRATVLIYILFLVTLATTFASIVLDNFSYLSFYSNYSDIENRLYENIKSRSKILVERNTLLNSNGSGFIDNISCPQSIVMSGNTLTSTINSTLTYTGGSIYCLATYQASDDLSIYFNTGYTDFNSADYKGFLSAISGGSGDFLDSDSTNIDFSSYNYMTGDLIDDDFNSDNYRGGSTGSTSYPNSYEDDDNLGRKELFGFVTPDLGFSKVFWSTSEVSDFIKKNSNNNDSLNVNIGSVSSARLYLDLDKAYNIKLIKIDKSIFDDIGELKILETLKGSGSTGNIGYLQNDLTLSGGVTGSEYNFDFTSNDYAIFLKSSSANSLYSTGTGTLFYKITGEDISSGSGMYIIPIDESDPDFIKYLGNEILIDNDGRYITKHAEVYYPK